MTDDIVNDLRQAEWNENQHTNVRLCAEAADEIERLRKMSYDLYLGLTTSVLIANANELTREAWTTYNNYMIELKDQSTN